MLARVIGYLRSLSAPRMLLWCYLLWYLFAVATYFDPNPRVWASSIGLSLIIGTGLYLSTAYAKLERTSLSFWQIFRFYLMPFCVSSFSALIKGRGFILIFHPSLAKNLQSLAVCAGFCLLVYASKTVGVGSAKATAQRLEQT